MITDISNLRSYKNKETTYIGWCPNCDSMTGAGNWTSTLTYENWNSFYGEFHNADNDYNIIVNYYFENNLEENYTLLNLWLLHPRKGASRGITIKNIEESDLQEIKIYLQDQFDNIKSIFQNVL